MAMDPEAKLMWRRAARFSAVGLEMGFAIIIGYLLGTWLDGLLGTEPYMQIFWTLAGVVAAFMAIYDVYKLAKKDVGID